MIRELKLTDLEVQKLIAPALKKKLRAAGFTMGASESADGFNCAFYFPVNLDLAGINTVERDEHGVWTFRQRVGGEAVNERLRQTSEDHMDAIEARMRAEREQ
jgi:hypothetical protein